MVVDDNLYLWADFLADGGKVSYAVSHGCARLEDPVAVHDGEAQKLPALINSPSILLTDEPTGNLDRATGEKVLELLFEEQERRAFSLLLVTHDERLAQRCSRVVYMEDGLIQADSTTPIPH